MNEPSPGKTTAFLIIGISLATAIASPAQVHAEPDENYPVLINAIHVVKASPPQVHAEPDAGNLAQPRAIHVVKALLPQVHPEPDENYPALINAIHVAKASPPRVHTGTDASKLAPLGVIQVAKVSPQLVYAVSDAKGLASLETIHISKKTSSPHAHPDPGANNSARLNAIYVADPAAPWFEEWTATNLKDHDWLYRPDITIKAGMNLITAVSSDPSGIGLLTRGELSRLEAAGAPKVATTSTDISVCAALSVNEARTEANFGDFALNTGMIELLATPDTLSIAEALIDAHRFKDRMTLKQVNTAFALAELSSEKPTLAMLPVLPHTQLVIPENITHLRPIEMTEAATEALRSHGLVPQNYRTSVFQRFPLVNGVRTACDEIVMITASEGAAIPNIFSAKPSSWTNPFSGSDLEKRLRGALDALTAMWQKSPEIKG